MIKKDEELRVPHWNKHEINRWADYIEFCCLYIDDHMISKDDVLSFFCDHEIEELHQGGAQYSVEYDRLNTVIENYYDIIGYRSRTHGMFYPFTIEDRYCIMLEQQLTEKHLHYIFLLICSNICFIDDRASVQKITHMFERYCCPIMKTLMPKDSQTELFGTARTQGFFGGNLGIRIKKLADCLGAQTTKTVDNDERIFCAKGGDAGLDIVSFLKLDEASHIPFALGQCTCSYDRWIDKQGSINWDTWRARLDPLAPFLQYMYVPFLCHTASGKFERAADIHTCLIDRQRILSILERYGNERLFYEMQELKLKDLLREIW